MLNCATALLANKHEQQQAANTFRQSTLCKVAHLFQCPLVPLVHFLLLVSLHLLVIKVLSGTFDVVEAELGVFLCFAGVIRQVTNSSGLIWFTVLEPGKQLCCTLFSKKILWHAERWSRNDLTSKQTVQHLVCVSPLEQTSHEHDIDCRASICNAFSHKQLDSTTPSNGHN